MGAMTNRNGYTFDEAVAAEVRAEMARQSLTTSTIADRIGVRRATIATRINGLAAFRSSELHGVARVLGLPAAELVARAELALDMNGAPAPAA